MSLKEVKAAQVPVHDLGQAPAMKVDWQESQKALAFASRSLILSEAFCIHEKEATALLLILAAAMGTGEQQTIDGPKLPNMMA